MLIEHHLLHNLTIERWAVQKRQRENQTSRLQNISINTEFATFILTTYQGNYFTFLFFQKLVVFWDTAAAAAAADLYAFHQSVAVMFKFK